jgi:hypothetical protein
LPQFFCVIHFFIIFDKTGLREKIKAMTYHKKATFCCLAILLVVSETGVPDFSLYNIPKRRKYTKFPQNIPNSHKIYQMAVK